jgi:TolA-binding protein
MSGPYDNVTILDVFAWLDTLTGWDIATHVEYQSLRDIALAQHNTIVAQLAEVQRHREDTKDHVDEVERRLDQMMIGHRNDPLMVDRAERVMRHLHILANQIIDTKMQLAEERARADTLSAKADALEQRVRHLECTPRISYSSGTRPGGDLAGTEAEAERSQMERFLTYHEHIEEFREVQRNPSLWMHRYINGDLPDTEGTHHE